MQIKLLLLLRIMRAIDSILRDFSRAKLKSENLEDYFSPGDTRK